MPNESYTHAAPMSKPNDLPMTGFLLVTQWAERFDMTEKQFRIWIHTYRIPYYQPGREMIVRAEDFWSRVPYITHDRPIEED